MCWVSGFSCSCESDLWSLLGLLCLANLCVFICWFLVIQIVSGKDLCISHIIAVEEKLSSGTQQLFKSLHQQYPNCNNAKNSAVLKILENTMKTTTRGYRNLSFLKTVAETLKVSHDFTDIVGSVSWIPVPDLSSCHSMVREVQSHR